MTTTLEALQTELAELPGLIVAAREQRKLPLARKYKARQEELVEEIENATITDLERQIATIDAEGVALIAEARELAAALEQATIAHKDATTALEQAHAAVQTDFFRSLNRQAARQALDAKRRVAVALQQAKMSAEPLQVSESFFNGLGGFRPATPTDPPHGDKKHWSPLESERSDAPVPTRSAGR